MYPDPDSRAEQFDDALERRQSGDEHPDDDPDLQELVQLASRLERTLPEDTPDPAFRDRLKQQLLSNEHIYTEPVELDSERWYRRLAASPWRLSAVAAALLVVVIVAVGMGMNTLSDDSDDEWSDTTSFQTLDREDSVRPEDSVAGFTGTATENQTWVASSFPPFDHDHVVLPPFLSDFLSWDEGEEPAVELNGADGMVEDTDMPETAPVYYLSAPSNGETMLTTLRSMLGVDGEIVTGSAEGEPYQVVNQNDEPVISWDPTRAFFHFRGQHLDEPITTGVTGEEAGAAEIALGFLEQIGFDLNTIQYQHRVTDTDAGSQVEFRPTNFPEMGLDMSLGGHITIGDDGTIQEAQLFWLSLIDSRNAVLRDPDEILRDIERGDGYMPPMPEAGDGDHMQMNVDDVRIAHVLTRLDEGSFVLQPALALSGDYGEIDATELPLVAEYVVKAAEDDE